MGRWLFLLALILSSVLMVLVLSPATPSWAAYRVAEFTIGGTMYTVNRQPFFMDVAPYIHNGRTYLPVRYAAYALGVPEGNVSYSNGVVSLVKNGRTVQMSIGSKALVVDGTTVPMDAAPVIKNGRTMLPLRWIAQAFGATVNWDPVRQKVTVSLLTPDPPAAEEAIAMVKASPEMSEAVAPFKRELDWKAEWVGDRWYVIGLFESPWGVRFVQDATIRDGRVYAYISYSERPPREWVVSKAREWGLRTFYTRLTPEIAIDLVKKSDDVKYALQDAQVLDGVAELIKDDAATQQWRFVFYAQRKDGSKAVLAVDGAREGDYIGVAMVSETRQTPTGRYRFTWQTGCAR